MYCECVCNFPPETPTRPAPLPSTAPTPGNGEQLGSCGPKFHVASSSFICASGFFCNTRSAAHISIFTGCGWLWKRAGYALETVKRWQCRWRKTQRTEIRSTRTRFWTYWKKKRTRMDISRKKRRGGHVVRTQLLNNRGKPPRIRNIDQTRKYANVSFLLLRNTKDSKQHWQTWA